MKSTDEITAAELINCAIVLFGKDTLLDPVQRIPVLISARVIMAAASCVNEFGLEAETFLTAWTADFRERTDKVKEETQRIKIEEFWKLTRYARKEDAIKLLKDFAMSLSDKEESKKGKIVKTASAQKKEAVNGLMNQWMHEGLNKGYLPLISQFRERRQKEGRAKGGKGRRQAAQ